MPRKVVTKASPRTKTARAKNKTAPAKGRAPADRVEHVPMTGRLRTLGTEQNVERVSAGTRTGQQEALAEQARATLRTEFERVFAIKDKLSAETKIGSTEKGRESRRSDEKVRHLVASLEGMNRFALAMGLITPAESREIYAEAMKRGLWQGWK